MSDGGDAATKATAPRSWRAWDTFAWSLGAAFFAFLAFVATALALRLRGEPPTAMSGLLLALGGARESATIVSPYFVPGSIGMSMMETAAQQGVRVKVLTNSLASTDEPLAQAAYAKYRKPLLERGVDLYELRPAAVEKRGRGSGSNVSLHAKAVVVDERTVFIGSMNLDPRSRLLNTEVGLIVENAPLAAAVKKFFATATMPGNAYHVVLEDGAVAWRSNEDDGRSSVRREPDAKARRKIHVALMKLLPIDNLL